MTKFIKVHCLDMSVLINLAHVREITCNTKGQCVIYFGFPNQNRASRDFIIPDETYDQVMRKVLGRE